MDALPEHTRSVRVGALIGVGVMAAVDEIVFHQLLAWHHFYDRSTTDGALLSDGLLHAAELVVLVAGLFLVADLARRRALVGRSAAGGFLAGAGAFQVFDGVVDHKVLGVHQIRYGVDLLPYDVTWNLAGAMLLVVGVVIAARSGRRVARAEP